MHAWLRRALFGNFSSDSGLRPPGTSKSLRQTPSRRRVLPLLAGGVSTVVVCALIPASPASAAVSNRLSTKAANAASEAPPAPPTTYTPLPADQVAALKAKALAMKKPDVSQVEDPSARTRMSRTLLDPVTATRITQVGSQALNYQDTKGVWQPIDNKLTAVTGGGWTNGANAYAVNLPADLSKPVVVADSANAAASVSLQLAPAKTPVTDLPPVPGVTVPVTIPVVSSVNGKTSGAAATYPGALPGVDVAYTAEGDAVKETATLASLATTDALPGASLTYTVHTGGGLTLQADAKVEGAINVLDSHGDTAFVIPPAVMNDDNGTTSSAVTTTLTADKSDPTTWTLTLTPDHAWLAAAGRAWPVVVDPTIGYPSAMAGCTLDSAAPTTSACSGTELATFWNSTGGAEKRALLRFDTLLDVIPADAQIAIAQLNVYVVNDASAVASQVNVRALTNPFTTSATWNKRDSTNNWTTAGGDRSATTYEQDTLYRLFTIQGVVGV